MAIGDIGSVQDTEQWRTGECYFPFLSHATGNIYFVTDAGTFIVRTVSIDSAGNIVDLSKSLTLESGATSGSKDVLHISGDVYAVAIAGATQVKVITFTCDSSGNLGAAEIDHIDLATTPANKSYYPHMIHVTGNVYAVAYTDVDDDGWVKTITINDDGSIDDTPLASWEAESDRGRLPWLVHISGTMYAVVFSSSSSNKGIVRTATIDASGIIAPTAKESQFEGVTNGYNGGIILPISGNNYVIFYSGPGSDGWVKTLTIADNGDISGVIDFWEFEPIYAGSPHAVEISDNAAGDGKVYCVGYSRTSTDQVRTIEVLNNGNIAKSIIDALILVAANWADSVSIVRVAYGIYAANYEDLTGANSGQVKSFDVEEKPSLPTVTTDEATDIEPTSATLNGTLDDDGGEACDCGFEYGLDTSYGTTTPTQSKNTGETFEQAITGLSPYTIYHFRAIATNSTGTSYGADRTTLGVTTDPATEVGQTTATLNGTLDSDGGEACNVRFEYGETTDYGSTTSWQSGKETDDTFSQEVPGLKGGTVYHFRAVATNSLGTNYGADRTFHTSALSAEAHQALGKGYTLGRAEL